MKTDQSDLSLLPILLQYEKEKSTLIQSGLLQSDGKYKSHIANPYYDKTISVSPTNPRTVEGPVYTIPTESDIAKKLESKKSLYEMKVSQGFTRLQIVPNGLPIQTYLDQISEEIIKQAKANHGKPQTIVDPNNKTKTKVITDYIYDTLDNPIELDINTPTYTWPGHIDNIWTTYDPTTKTQVPETQHTHNTGGFDLILLEEDNGKLIELPRAGAGATTTYKVRDSNGNIINKERKQIEAGQTGECYIKLFTDAQSDPTSPHHGEYGMNRQSDLTLILHTLIQSQQMLGNYNNQSSCANYALASQYMDGQSAVVSFSRWFAGVRRLVCDRQAFDGSVLDGVPRVSVRVY